MSMEKVLKDANLDAPEPKVPTKSQQVGMHLPMLQ
jgi:hypothetical protein